MDLEALKAALEHAKKAVAENKTPETMQAVVDAWNALNEATPRRKRAGCIGPGSRLGRRRAAEQRALQQYRR